MFVFDGGDAPVLDANNQIVTDASGNPGAHHLTARRSVSRTLMCKRRASPVADPRLGGGATQFTIEAGNPYSSMVAGRRRPLRAGRLARPSQLHLEPRPALRNADEHPRWRDLAPRFGFAWAPGTAKNGRQKTVVRGGFGMFYDRIDESLTCGRCCSTARTSFQYTRDESGVPTLRRYPPDRREQHLPARSQICAPIT